MRSKLQVTSILLLAPLLKASMFAQQACIIQTDCINPTFSVCNNGVCMHKNVFPPNALEIGGVIILPLLLGFANIGGVGGGGLIIPVCIAMFGFNTI